MKCSKQKSKPLYFISKARFLKNCSTNFQNNAKNTNQTILNRISSLLYQHNNNNNNNNNISKDKLRAAGKSSS